MKLVDLTGKVFSRLTVVGRAPSARGNTKWLCCCSCGNMREVFTTCLRNGETKSCGCYKSELLRVRMTKHGHAGKWKQHSTSSSTYGTWRAMLSRCYTKTDADYKHYGGRGIYVCQRWRKSFVNFLDDMGERPAPHLSLDRVNNDGPYSKANCRWATASQQRVNKRQPRGWQLSAEARAAISRSLKGKPKPVQTRRALSRAAKQRHAKRKLLDAILNGSETL
jgi:hypothetical protein